MKTIQILDEAEVDAVNAIAKAYDISMRVSDYADNFESDVFLLENEKETVVLSLEEGIRHLATAVKADNRKKLNELDSEASYLFNCLVQTLNVEA